MARVELNRVLVQDCGDKNRDIYIYKAKPKIIHIGCWQGTYEEAIERITETYYNNNKRKAYIGKVKECFKAVPLKWKYKYLVPYTITLDKNRIDFIRVVSGIIAVIILFITLANIFIARECKDPIMIFNSFMLESPFSAYLYLTFNIIAIVSISYEFLKTFKIQKNNK
jgi:hypothetical protein